MNRKTIKLNDEKQLRIFMLPLRQKILRTMGVVGTPMTAKQLADQLNITPSSAKHHLGKLEEIGLVIFDHEEIINGIIAKFFATADVDVSIGQDRFDDLSNERNALARNILADTYEGYIRAVNKYRTEVSPGFIGDILSGIAHLTNEQAEKIYRDITDVLNENTKAKSDTNPWQFALVCFREDKKQ